MRILVCAVVFLSVLPGPSNAQPDELQRQVLAKERQELDCLKTGNYEEFASLLADDAVFVDPHGAAGKPEIVENTREVRLIDYTMDGLKFVPLSRDSGLLIYKLTEAGTAHGRPFNATVFVSALWGKRDGTWVCLYSQETPARQR